jgi:hypothetical protein
VADAEGARRLDQPVDEDVVDPRRRDQPRARRAPLPRLEERALDRALDRDVEVRVVEDHERVLAAHLELHASEPLGAGERHLTPDRL